MYSIEFYQDSHGAEPVKDFLIEEDYQKGNRMCQATCQRIQEKK